MSCEHACWREELCLCVWSIFRELPSSIWYHPPWNTGFRLSSLEKKWLSSPEMWGVTFQTHCHSPQDFLGPLITNLLSSVCLSCCHCPEKTHPQVQPNREERGRMKMDSSYLGPFSLTSAYSWSYLQVSAKGSPILSDSSFWHNRAGGWEHVIWVSKHTGAKIRRNRLAGSCGSFRMLRTALWCFHVYQQGHRLQTNVLPSQEIS